MMKTLLDSDNMKPKLSEKEKTISKNCAIFSPSNVIISNVYNDDLLLS